MSQESLPLGQDFIFCFEVAASFLPHVTRFMWCEGAQLPSCRINNWLISESPLTTWEGAWRDELALQALGPG